MISNTYWKSVRDPYVDHGKLGLAIECRMAFSCKELRHLMNYYIIVLLLPKICLPKINLSGFSPLTYPVIMNDIISWYLDVCFCSGIALQECADLSRKNFSASISLKKYTVTYKRRGDFMCVCLCWCGIFLWRYCILSCLVSLNWPWEWIVTWATSLRVSNQQVQRVVGWLISCAYFVCWLRESRLILERSRTVLVLRTSRSHSSVMILRYNLSKWHTDWSFWIS